MSTHEGLDMVEGYLDGFDLNSPEPSANRSRCYIHGFANGRADRTTKSNGRASELRKRADEAMATDRATREGL